MPTVQQLLEAFAEMGSRSALDLKSGGPRLAQEDRPDSGRADSPSLLCA